MHLKNKHKQDSTKDYTAFKAIEQPQLRTQGLPAINKENHFKQNTPPSQARTTFRRFQYQKKKNREGKD